ncbi:hypothetical protein LINGRAHAP2_LOCUS8891 [Linum grandiflorum]
MVLFTGSGSGTRCSESGSPDHRELRIEEEEEEEEEENFDFKDPDMWGVVFGCSHSVLKVDLMNLKSGQIRHISVSPHPEDSPTDFSVTWSYAVVESKLFAVGGQPKYVEDPTFYGFPMPVYPREVYFCDLRDAKKSVVDGEYCLEFKIAATLNEAKISPFLVPYKDKIFIIANSCEEPRWTTTNTPCEILHLGGSEFHVEPLPSPEFVTREDHFIDGHVVISNKLYIRVLTPKRARSLYCLDMDAQDWKTSQEIPHILKEVYPYGDKRPLNYVHGDKFLFTLEFDGEDPSVPSFSVEIFKEDGDVCNKIEVDLKPVVDSMRLPGRYYIFDGWVLPCEENVFCLMLWMRDLTESRDTYICLCKFQLADDGFFKILTQRVFCGPIPSFYSRPLIAFTPAISKVPNAGDYGEKLRDRDRQLEKKAKKALKQREEAKREEARREAESFDPEFIHLDLFDMPCHAT